jgi:hypothetical protein
LVEADWFKGEWSTLCVYAILDREWQARRDTRQRAQQPSSRSSAIRE